MKRNLLLVILLLISDSFASDGILLYSAKTNLQCPDALLRVREFNSMTLKGKSLFIVAETPRTLIAFVEEKPEKATYDEAQANIYDRESGQQLGYLLIKAHPNANVRLPIRLFEAHGKGLGTEAKYAVIRFVFERWNSQVVEAHINHDNIASIRLHEKLGFKRRWPEIDTEVLRYDLSRKDFLKIQRHFSELGPEAFMPRDNVSDTNMQ